MPASPLASVQLHLVQSVSDVLECREWVSHSRETPVAFDTETEGLVPQRHRLRLIQLGDMRHGWAFPFEWAGAAIEIIRDLIARRKPVVAHNSGFDHRFIQRWLGYDIPWHLVHDTMILAALADPTRPKGLKPLAERFIDPAAAAGQSLLNDGMRANGWTWATVPADFPPYWSYAALDPVLTCHIWDTLADRVLKQCPEAYDLERAVVPVLSSMMDAGMLIDREYITATTERLRRYSESARAWLRDVHGVGSLMSAREIAAALGQQGAEVTEFTGSGLPSVTKEYLKYLTLDADITPGARELARVILKARHAEKLSGTYLENFLAMATADGTVHCNIKQLEARSSRMSCSDPNLQNLPRDDKVVRGGFIPRPGWVFISCDFSQIEMRLFAALSGDEGLIKAFADADATGTDFYATIASDLFGEPVSKSDPRRQSVKSAGYAAIFGAGIGKQAQTAGVSIQKYRPIRAALDARYPGFTSYPREIASYAARHADESGRPCVHTSTQRPLFIDPKHLYAATNYRIQPEAAECLKRAGVALASAGLMEYMRLFVHDEVILEVPAQRAEDMRRAVEDVMTDTTRYAVPLTCEAKIMPERWVKG